MKKELRSKILKERKNINITEYDNKSLIIQKNVLEFLSQKKFNSIGLYVPIKKEVDTNYIFDNLTGDLYVSYWHD